MTEKELREAPVNVLRSWLGVKAGSDKHAEILNIYNTHRPLARSYKVKLSDQWCAATVSAAFIAANMADIIGTECGCGEMIQKAQKLGLWCENDDYKPNTGDVILYCLKNTAKGDCTSWPDHVGVVEKVSGNSITVIEGNMGSPRQVGRRTISVDDEKIRGYILPKYAEKADPEPKEQQGEAITALNLRIGPSAAYGFCNIEKLDGYGVRHYLRQGERVKILREVNGWLQIEVVGRYVWQPYVSGKYIKLI